jgi:hypothetical protein
MTKVKELGAYELISQVYGSSGDAHIHWDKEMMANMSKMDLYRQTAHELSDLVVG